ncbi:MAG: hypothetical protein ICV60_13205 [Pyrinomonadaceae bacterium]|nr:hypothetical protein [Pyrinomonadaceae bacterium]
MNGQARETEGRAPNLEKIDTVIEAIDREIDFYRKRAGQVFFFSLLVEVLILAGREQVFLPKAWLLAQPITYSLLFIAVAAVGIALGSEYRQRIRELKNSRVKILWKINHKAVYPSRQKQVLSEIQVLYVVLIFLSSGGIILVWLNLLGGSENLSIWSKVFSALFMAVGAVGLAYSIYKVGRWLYRTRRLNSTAARLERRK